MTAALEVAGKRCIYASDLTCHLERTCVYGSDARSRCENMYYVNNLSLGNDMYMTTNPKNR